MKSRKIILTCAVTGSGDTVKRNPAVPVTPEQIATSALEAAEAGAAVVHIHVRDPATGLSTMDDALYRDVFNRLKRSNTKAVINLTTGPGATFVPTRSNPLVAAPGSNLTTPEKRVAHILELRPEICSLDLGTMNFHERPYIVPPDHLRDMARLIAEAGVKPELEAFDSGDIEVAKHLVQKELVSSPPMIQFVLGVPFNAQANPKSLHYLSGLLPDGFIWGGMGLSSGAFPMIAQSILLGGHARVGLEDTLYIEPGQLATSNRQLVEKARRIIETLGFSLASPAEAREILSLS